MAEDSEDDVVIVDPCASPDRPDLQFEPIIYLPPVETKTLEEDEDEIIRLRAKLFRFDSGASSPEWKERGTGDVKFLKHREKGHVRLLMRRDKTLKVCANHFVLPEMNLKPNCGSERAWVWNTPADFADDESKSELLAIRFGSVENAQKFKAAFDNAKSMMKEQMKATEKGDKEAENGVELEKVPPQTNGKAEKGSEDSVTEKLGELTVKETGESVQEKGGTGDSAEQKATPPTEAKVPQEV